MFLKRKMSNFSSSDLLLPNSQHLLLIQGAESSVTWTCQGPFRLWRCEAGRRPRGSSNSSGLQKGRRFETKGADWQFHLETLGILCPVILKTCTGAEAAHCSTWQNTLDYKMLQPLLD